MDFLKLGIIGQPLTHSLSPLLHAQLLHLSQQQGEYRKYQLQPSELPNALQEFSRQGVRGLNVTIPHKVSVMKAMDWLSPEAELAGAVNTIVFESDENSATGKKLKGYNTDITGFMRSLPASLLDRLPDSNLLILGAGGSARAVMTGLIQAQTASITFAVRDPVKAISLTSDGEMIKQTYQSATQLKLISLDSLPSLEGFDGLINTTPVGMYPNESQSPITAIQLETLPAGSLVYDLIYRPTETQLLQAATARNLHAVNGLDMLIYQGICSFELWSEKDIPDTFVEPVRHQLQTALKSAVS
jgi:shikimate dehydrogenase